MFLLDAEAFSAALEDAHTDSDAGYERCVEIVHKYIKEGSPYEVNIESKTRNEILGATDRKIFFDLTLVRQSTTCVVFLPGGLNGVTVGDVCSASSLN